VSDVTRLIEAVQRGETNAAEDLLPLVYDELRRLAAYRLAREGAPHTLQPTALVHEVWLKVAGGNSLQWSGRSHFFSAAAEAMRRILIDVARRKSRLKRGGNKELAELDESKIELNLPAEDFLELHEALDALDKADHLAAEVVKLRYFIGLSVAEIADVMALAPRTVDRHWAFARAWLKRAIKGEPLP
jgi:RNA polymerase sigma factor (TIGR02999 family)